MDTQEFAKCFAHGENGRHCMILTEDLCRTKGKCPFFKTQEQFMKDSLHADVLNVARNLNCA